MAFRTIASPGPSAGERYPALITKVVLNYGAASIVDLGKIKDGSLVFEPVAGKASGVSFSVGYKVMFSGEMISTGTGGKNFLIDLLGNEPDDIYFYDSTGTIYKFTGDQMGLTAGLTIEGDFENARVIPLTGEGFITRPCLSTVFSNADTCVD